MEIKYRKLSDLHPNPKNPRRGGVEAVQKLADSIKANPAFFEARPILLSDRTGELVIIGGERRSEAALLLGMTEVPTILMSGLTEAQEDEIMIRDNTHAGVWDNVKLAEIASKWGSDNVKNWASDVKWDADAFVKSTIPELAGLGEEKQLAEILEEEGKLARERVIITFPPEKKNDVAKLLQLDAIKKVLYRIEEIEK